MGQPTVSNIEPIRALRNWCVLKREEALTMFQTGGRPFFKKSETFHPPSQALQEKYNVTHNPDVFGTSGPIQISYNEEYSASHALWHDTLNSLGVKTNPSHHSGSNIGVWTNINTVDPRVYERSYSATYLSGVEANNNNLHIITSASVKHINLASNETGHQATGVCFEWNGQEYHASAKHEVIVSAGSAKSPQVLEQSGIGRRDILEAAGVPVLVDSPMVGENLQDHISRSPFVNLVIASRFPLTYTSVDHNL